MGASLDYNGPQEMDYNGIGTFRLNTSDPSSIRTNSVGLNGDKHFQIKSTLLSV